MVLTIGIGSGKLGSFELAWVYRTSYNEARALSEVSFDSGILVFRLNLVLYGRGESHHLQHPSYYYKVVRSSFRHVIELRGD